MIEEKKNLIREYIVEEECIYDEKPFNCGACSNIEECFLEAENKCNSYFNDTFAKAVNYGGYDNEEDFWEQLLN